MTDLNLAKKDIQKIQNKLQQELDLEQQRTKTNETKYVQRLQEETEAHQSELNAMRHTMKVSVQNARQNSLKGMVSQTSVVRIIQQNDEALALAVKERTKLTQEHERQQSMMSNQLKEHLKENEILSLQAAKDLSTLRAESDTTTEKYKAQEQRLLLNIESMKKSEELLRNTLTSELEKER